MKKKWNFCHAQTMSNGEKLIFYLEKIIWVRYQFKEILLKIILADNLSKEEKHIFTVSFCSFSLKLRSRNHVL